MEVSLFEFLLQKLTNRTTIDLVICRIAIEFGRHEICGEIDDALSHRENSQLQMSAISEMIDPSRAAFDGGSCKLFRRRFRGRLLD
jgi:hypothetical protein